LGDTPFGINKGDPTLQRHGLGNLAFDNRGADLFPIWRDPYNNGGFHLAGDGQHSTLFAQTAQNALSLLINARLRQGQRGPISVFTHAIFTMSFVPFSL
jgi:hypothetical protein